MENKILTEFRTKFKSQKDIGNEYFEGEYKTMMDIIYLIVKNEEVDDNEIHFQDDDAAPLPSIEQKPRRKLLIQKTVISTGGQNNENDTSSSSKVRVRMTPSEIRASARHSKVPLKLPLLSNIPKPLPPQQDDAALSSRRQERSESSRDRSPRRVHEDDGMPRKKRPLYQRMIARAFRKEQLELMKKVYNLYNLAYIIVQIMSYFQYCL